MLIAIISDTHMPQGNRRLPESCVEQLRTAELIIHAGDLVQMSVLRELEAYSQVIAVQGNVDVDELRAKLPKTAELQVDGATLAVVHDAGLASGRLNRLRRQFPEADAVVFGHSHLPLHLTAPDGFQLFNPGSPTERRRAPSHTMGVATVREGRVSFELLDLG